MRFVRWLVPMLVAAGVQMAAAQPPDVDTLWLFKDSIKVDTEKLYYKFGGCDTSEGQHHCFGTCDTIGGKHNCIDTVDTGDAYNASYVDFHYQFTSAQPGFAGFKLFWDDGMTLFNVINYDSLYLVHKGPLSTHKVKIIFKRGTGCGAPTIAQTLGEFKSSSVWKKTTIPLPDTSQFARAGLYEMRFLIYNDSGTTTPTSAPGELKVDNIGFIKKSTAGVSRMMPRAATAANGFFIPAVSGKVVLSLFSLQGEQLFRGTIGVSAGTKYNVNRFALSHSKVPASLIRCVQITGAGVNVTQKVCR